MWWLHTILAVPRCFHSVLLRPIGKQPDVLSLHRYRCCLLCTPVFYHHMQFETLLLPPCDIYLTCHKDVSHCVTPDDDNLHDALADMQWLLWGCSELQYRIYLFARHNKTPCIRTVILYKLLRVRCAFYNIFEYPPPPPLLHLHLYRIW